MLNEGIAKIDATVQRLKRAFHDRDQRMRDVRDVRSGKLDNVTPGAMPDIFPYPIVANLIDTTARDMAEVMATMPSLNCSSGVMTSERAKKFTSKRTKIALSYTFLSKLEIALVDFFDHYNTYGMGIFGAEPDFETKMPRIRVINPIGAYPEIDVWGRLNSFTRCWRESSTTLAAKFPQFAKKIIGEQDKGMAGIDSLVEVVLYCDKDEYVMYLPERGQLVLDRMDNALGKIPFSIAIRPGFDDEVRGAFDDAKWVQIAKGRMALLAMEASEKSVRAPIVIPRDVTTMNFGDDALIRTDGKVEYVQRDMPNAAFAQGQMLERETTLAVRSNQVRQGDVDASVITGKGLQQLSVGFSTVISTGQKVGGRSIADIISLCFEIDERFFPNEKKEVRGVHQGTPFEETYTPSKDINGNYMIDVTYGFASGLDPSRALVFLLQLRGDQLVPRDFVQRQLPMDIDVMQMQTQIDNEQVTDALKQGVFAYVQSVGILAQQGQDPMEILQRVAKIVDLREKGKPMHEAILEAFEPPKPTPQEQAAMEAGGAAPGGPGGELPFGMNASGLPRGVAAGQAGMPPGGSADVMSLLAGLRGGQPSLGASVQRRMAVGT